MNRGVHYSDPVTGLLFVPSTRVRALQAIWEDREAAANKNGMAVPLTREPAFDEANWNSLRQTLAQLWAALESEQKQLQRSSADVVGGMATILEPIRHEIGFINSISAEVDRLLAEKGKVDREGRA